MPIYCAPDFITPVWGVPLLSCRGWVRPPARFSLPVAGASGLELATKQGNLHVTDFTVGPDGITVCSERQEGHGWKAYVDRCNGQLQVKLSRKSGPPAAFVNAEGPSL